MSLLSDIINSGQQWAIDRANYAVQVSEAVASGQLSAEEVKEILADLISTEKLEESANNAQLRAALVELVTIAAKAMA